MTLNYQPGYHPPEVLRLGWQGNSVAPDVARAIVMANYVQQTLEMAAD